jgi:hypothetical protein
MGKKKPVKKATWGGVREGSGRPPNTPKGVKVAAFSIPREDLAEFEKIRLRKELTASAAAVQAIRAWVAANR